jgi:hypothetical protein
MEVIRFAGNLDGGCETSVESGGHRKIKDPALSLQNAQGQGRGTRIGSPRIASFRRRPTALSNGPPGPFTQGQSDTQPRTAPATSSRGGSSASLVFSVTQQITGSPELNLAFRTLLTLQQSRPQQGLHSQSHKAEPRSRRFH